MVNGRWGGRASDNAGARDRVGALSSSELAKFQKLPANKQTEIVQLLEKIKRYQGIDPMKAKQFETKLRDLESSLGVDAPPAQLKAKATQLVTNLLLAKRSGNIKREQAAHQKLATWCQANNVNMENAIRGVTKEKQGSVAALMGGLV